MDSVSRINVFFPLLILRTRNDYQEDGIYSFGFSEIVIGSGEQDNTVIQIENCATENIGDLR